MRVVIALGGNAMTGPDGSATVPAQRAAIAQAAERVADLVGEGLQVILTHGNGPQVGNLLVKNELAADTVPPVPLDWCVAQTQATIGYTVLNALHGALAARGLHQPAAVLVTRVLVDADDPAFTHPTKPVGRYLPAAEAARFVALGQHWADFGPRGWRRVVASPRPQAILDVPAVVTLADAGYLVVTTGGGGIPVRPDGAGQPQGVEAVIDKDLCAALLATQVGAEALVIATDVPGAQLDHGTGRARRLGAVRPAELAAYLAAGQFPAGSMGPKVTAALGFVEAGGRRAAITTLDGIAEAATAPTELAAKVATVVEADRDPAGPAREQRP